MPDKTSNGLAKAKVDVILVWRHRCAMLRLDSDCSITIAAN